MEVINDEKNNSTYDDFDAYIASLEEEEKNRKQV